MKLFSASSVKIMLTAMLTAGAFMLSGAAKKIVFVGDSISCGVGASPREMRYSTVAVKLLNDKENQYIEKNIAISGSTMSDQLWPIPKASAYPHRIKDVIKENPDIVVVQHGVNDNGVRVSLAEYVWSYRQFVREVKKALPKAKIVCMTLTPTWRSPANELWLSLANAAIQEIAARENCLIVQINQALDGNRKFFPDSLHPNNDGYRVMAETFAAAIRENRVRSSDCFDFSMRKDGTYEVCGWRFEISAAAAKGGFTVFRDMGKNGFTYSSYGQVRVFSPLSFYPSEVLCKAEGLSAAPQLSWNHYSKDIIITLPATNGKTVKVSITDPPPFTGTKEVKFTSLQELKKEWNFGISPQVGEVSCADGIFTATVKVPNREFRLSSRRKFQNVRMEMELKFNRTDKGFNTYFGMITTSPWHHDSAWVMRANSENGTFYVHANGKANKNSNSVRVAKFTPDVWHKVIIDCGNDGAALYVDGKLLGRITDKEIVPTVGMQAIFSINCKQPPFTMQIRNLKFHSR